MAAFNAGLYSLAPPVCKRLYSVLAISCKSVFLFSHRLFLASAIFFMRQCSVARQKGSEATPRLDITTLDYIPIQAYYHGND